MGNGLTDHELLMEMREDIQWIRTYLGATVTRKEFYGVITTLITIGIGVAAFI